MKKLFLMMLCLFVVSFSFAQDLVEGYWKSVDENGVITAGWKIYQKEGKLYGEIIKVPGTDAGELAAECKGPYKNFPVKNKGYRKTDQTLCGAMACSFFKMNIKNFSSFFSIW